MQYTISAEVSGRLVAIKYGATHTNYADQRDLARGLSAGVGRTGITRAPIETVEGPMVPDAIVVTNENGHIMHRYLDTLDSQPDVMLWRHRDGLVYFAGGQ
jgi:hypothetical protein